MSTQITYPNSTLTTTNLTVSEESTFSGSTQFTYLVSAPLCPVLPTKNNELTIKQYVDTATRNFSDGLNMYLNWSVLSEGSYRQLGRTIVDIPIISVDTIITDNTNQLVAEFLSDNINTKLIPAGVWNALIYGSVDSAFSAFARYIFEVYQLKSSGTQNFLCSNTYFSSVDINTPVGQLGSASLISATLGSNTNADFTDKIIFKLYVRTNTTSFPVTIRTTF